MKKWKIAIPVLAIALFAAWYAFRPERLFVNDRVNEGFPATEGASSAEIMESGTFYGVMHPTTGTATIYRLGAAIAFSALRTSGRRPALTFMCTWWPPMMHETTLA